MPVPGGNFRWVVNKKKVYCPAVTLSLLATHDEEELLSVDVVPALETQPSQKWPQPALNGLNVDNWLGKKTRLTLCCSVHLTNKRLELEQTDPDQQDFLLCAQETQRTQPQPCCQRFETYTKTKHNTHNKLTHKQ